MQSLAKRQSHQLESAQIMAEVMGEPALLSNHVSALPNGISNRSVVVELRAGIISAPPRKIRDGLYIPIKNGKRVVVGIGLRSYLHEIETAEGNWELMHLTRTTKLHVGKIPFFSWFGWENYELEQGALGLDWALPLRLLKAIEYRPAVPAREPHRSRERPWDEIFIKLYGDYHRFPESHKVHHEMKGLLEWLGEKVELGAPA